MAGVVTYTSSVFKNNTPKYSHIATLSVSGQGKWTGGVNAGASTVGDILFCCKVPHGAKIYDAYEFHSTGATATALSMGFDRGIAAGGAGNLSCLVSSGAQATMNRMSLANSPNTANSPVTISLSDLDPVRYAILCLKLESGTTTTSLFANFGIMYRFDGPDPV